jgi:transcriptional regulator with XRE-family HTH domain
MTETVKRLKKEMDCQGISQATLAKRMRLSESAVSRWFNGSRNPSIVQVEKMAKALDVKILIFK